MLIAQAVFVLESRQTDKQTDRETRLNVLPTLAAMPAWVTMQLIMHFASINTITCGTYVKLKL